MVAGIQRNEVIAVALLAMGMVLLANPAYTQSGEGSAASVQAQEVDTDGLSPRTVAQLRSNMTILPIIEYERLSERAQSIFDAGRNDVYLIRNRSEGDVAVLQSAVLYEDDVYLRQTQNTPQGVELRYLDTSGRFEVNLMSTSLMSPEQRSAFREATGSSVNLTVVSRGLSRYDFIYDNETGEYYEGSTEVRGNVTVFSAERVEAGSLIDPAFVDSDDLGDEEREAAVAAIEGGGSGPVVTGGTLSALRSNRNIRHEGGYYRLRFGQASPPITEALGPVNFLGMAVGVLFILGSGYMVRRVYKEKETTVEAR